MKTFSEKRNADPTKKAFVATYGYNMGHRTLGLDMSIRDLMGISIVRNRAVEDEGDEAQRPLDDNHAKGLAKHTIVGLVQTQMFRDKVNGIDMTSINNLQKQLGHSAYAVLQPIVCNIRNCEKDGNDLEISDILETQPDGTLIELPSIVRIYLGIQHILSVVDGQHRREGFDIALRWLKKICDEKKYPKVGLFSPNDSTAKGDFIREDIYEFWQRVMDTAYAEAHVKVEVHLGLSTKEERQLFADLNNKVKAVDKSLSLSFDRSDAVNYFIEETLIAKKAIKNNIVVNDKSEWQNDEGSIIRKDINPITSLVMFGKGSSKNITPAQVDPRGSIAEKFWHSVQQISGYGIKNSRTLTVASQPVVLKAIAKLAYDLGYNTSEKNEEHLKALWNGITKGNLDFSHNNKIWRSLMLDSAGREKEFPGISKYLHVPIGTNLDAGTFDKNKGWVRYGSKHNDLFPRIGDLIRFELNFNPRKSVTKSIEKENEIK